MFKNNGKLDRDVTNSKYNRNNDPLRHGLQIMETRKFVLHLIFDLVCERLSCSAILSMLINFSVKIDISCNS